MAATLVDDEQTKLTANFLNALASGMAITGLVSPVVLLALDIAKPSADAQLALFVFGEVCWIIIAALLHFLGRRVLLRLAYE
jgi:hypothetical protein